MTVRPANPVIALAGIAKAYRRRRVLDGLDLAVGPGEIVGLLGPNGSGKTTTMRIAAGYLWADAGTVAFGGESLTPARRDLRRSIGYLPERVPLYDAFRVDRYLRFVAAARGLAGESGGAAVENVVESCGLTAVARSPISRLSKGYRQRVGLAQALMGDPRLLLLDEPTNGLDPLQTREARDLIRSVSRDRAVILSTHLLPEVAALCTRVVYLRDGRLVEFPLVVAATPGRDCVAAVLAVNDGTNVETALKTLDGVIVLERHEGPADRLRLVLSLPEDVRLRGRVATLLASHANLIEYGPLTDDLEARLVAAMGHDGESC